MPEPTAAPASTIICMSSDVARAPVFIDTAYFVALLNERDTFHARAKGLALTWTKAKVELVTSDAILIELANFFARSPLRPLAAAAIREVRATPGFAVERIVAKLLDRAEARYTAHPDKAWSLTDCLSMEIMLQYGSTDVATTDRHFTQAGFKTLMGS